jgi:hypothetical protein
MLLPESSAVTPRKSSPSKSMHLSLPSSAQSMKSTPRQLPRHEVEVVMYSDPEEENEDEDKNTRESTPTRIFETPVTFKRIQKKSMSQSPEARYKSENNHRDDISKTGSPDEFIRFEKVDMETPEVEGPLKLDEDPHNQKDNIASLDRIDSVDDSGPDSPLHFYTQPRETLLDADDDNESVSLFPLLVSENDVPEDEPVKLIQTKLPPTINTQNFVPDIATEQSLEKSYKKRLGIESGSDIHSEDFMYDHRSGKIWTGAVTPFDAKVLLGEGKAIWMPLHCVSVEVKETNLLRQPPDYIDTPMRRFVREESIGVSSTNSSELLERNTEFDFDENEKTQVNGVVQVPFDDDVGEIPDSHPLDDFIIYTGNGENVLSNTLQDQRPEEQQQQQAPDNIPHKRKHSPDTIQNTNETEPRENTKRSRNSSLTPTEPDTCNVPNIPSPPTGTSNANMTARHIERPLDFILQKLKREDATINLKKWV